MADFSLVPKANVATSVKTPATTLGVHDTMRHGFTSVRATTAPEHPIKVVQDNFQAQQDRLHFAVQRLAFGAHMPIRLQMERHIVSQTGRLPALAGSNLGMDILMGKDEVIEFEDYLSDPAELMGTFDPHTTMEHKLKMNMNL